MIHTDGTPTIAHHTRPGDRPVTAGIPPIPERLAGEVRYALQNQYIDRYYLWAALCALAEWCDIIPPEVTP